MNPAEKRIKELIDRWLTSIELHLQYTELSDEAYWELRNWPKHDRPTRWVLELAKQKATELQDIFNARVSMGDSKFSDSLELMAFLANLVGAQHVERFVPLAERMANTTTPQPKPRSVPAAPESSGMPSWYAQAQTNRVASAPRNDPPPPPQRPPPVPAPQQPYVVAPAQHRADADTTREMPTPRQQPQRSVDPEATREMPASRAQPPRNDPDATREMPKFRGQPTTPARTAATKGETRKGHRAAQQSAAAKSAPPTKEPDSEDEQLTMVIADAVRMLNWGKTWHELAEHIARLADRPPVAEVRKILRTHRVTIEKTAKATK